MLQKREQAPKCESNEEETIGLYFNERRNNKKSWSKYISLQGLCELCQYNAAVTLNFPLK
jgi:hypothetical protein